MAGPYLISENAIRTQPSSDVTFVFSDWENKVLPLVRRGREGGVGVGVGVSLRRGRHKRQEVLV